MNPLAEAKIIIDAILKIEGEKFTDDPSDSGGATKWGVTEKVAREYGYYGDMRDLTRVEAGRIFYTRYLVKIRYETLLHYSRLIADEMADTSINMGHERAIEFLQRSLNIYNNRGTLYPDTEVDGIMGEHTLHCLSEYISFRGDEGIRVLYSTLNSLQGAFYVELAERREKDEKYTYGWHKNRVLGSH